MAKSSSASSMPLAVSQEGRELIKRWEGLRLEAYRCPSGVWTVGYGHTRTAREGMRITQQEAELLLDRDLSDVASRVRRLVRVPLTQHQFDALCSFVFNVGPAAFGRSTLLRKLNEGDYESVPNELMRWVYSGGRRLAGLVNRRAAEAGLWSRGSFVTSSFVAVEEKPGPNVLQTDTGRGALTTGAAGLLAVAFTAAREAGELVASIPLLAHLPAWAGAALVLATVVGVLIWRANRA